MADLTSVETPPTAVVSAPVEGSQVSGQAQSQAQGQAQSQAQAQAEAHPHAQATVPPPPFSWLDSHPIFVIILVGPDEQPYGIQKDYLCARSRYYREYFQTAGESESLEYLVKLPDTPVEVFAYAQNYLFTGKVFPSLETMPSYEVLVGLWKLGHELVIDGLCDATLEAMAECRRLTESIPATPLLVQVWHDTPEDSSIRKLLLSWAAEYMRSSEARKAFAKSLPQEVLSELVVAMSSLDTTPLVQVGRALPGTNTQVHLKNVHYLDDEEGEVPAATGIKKKARHSDVLPNGSSAPTQAKAVPVAKKPRTSLPSTKPAKRRSHVSFVGEQPFSTDQKMNFCADLLTRMLSGPGFWTRLVGPFKEPVDPQTDGVPDYLQKVSRPMDLGTMKAKMDRHEYQNEQEFVNDMRQIFTNCYTYWTKKDAMWSACEKLEKTFEEKYSQMNKWISKMEGEEML